MHANGLPKMVNDGGVGVSMQHVLPAMYDHQQIPPNNNELSGQNGDDKRKRHRRTATEIQRHYKCPVEGCHKSYGSEGSMNQHMKLKHVEFYRQQIQIGNLQSGPGRISAR